MAQGSGPGHRRHRPLPRQASRDAHPRREKVPRSRTSGLRDLDRRTENLPGMTRNKKDVNRTMPRDGTDPVSSSSAATGYATSPAHRLPAANTEQTEDRTGPRPRTDRAKAPSARYSPATTELKSINDQLSLNVGDIAELDDGPD